MLTNEYNKTGNVTEMEATIQTSTGFPYGVKHDFLNVGMSKPRHVYTV